MLFATDTSLDVVEPGYASLFQLQQTGDFELGDTSDHLGNFESEIFLHAAEPQPRNEEDHASIAGEGGIVNDPEPGTLTLDTSLI